MGGSINFALYFKDRVSSNCPRLRLTICFFDRAKCMIIYKINQNSKPSEDELINGKIMGLSYDQMSNMGYDMQL